MKKIEKHSKNFLIAFIISISIFSIGMLIFLQSLHIQPAGTEENAINLQMVIFTIVILLIISSIPTVLVYQHYHLTVDVDVPKEVDSGEMITVKASCKGHGKPVGGILRVYWSDEMIEYTIEDGVCEIDIPTVGMVGYHTVNVCVCANGFFAGDASKEIVIIPKEEKEELS